MNLIDGGTENISYPSKQILDPFYWHDGYLFTERDYDTRDIRLNYWRFSESEPETLMDLTPLRDELIRNVPKEKNMDCVLVNDFWLDEQSGKGMIPYYLKTKEGDRLGIIELDLETGSHSMVDVSFALPEYQEVGSWAYNKGFSRDPKTGNSDIQILNIEPSAKNHVYADISWVDTHDGYNGQMYGAIEISFFMGGYLKTELLGAYHGEMDMSNLNGKIAEYGNYNIKLKIEECTSEKLVLNMDGVRYEYIRDTENDDSEATRFYYVSTGDNIEYYISIGWGGVNRYISRICLKTREHDNKREDGDVILELSEKYSYADPFVVQNG